MTKMENEAILGEDTKIVPGINMADERSIDVNFPSRRLPETKDDVIPPSICTSCNEKITDKYYMKVDGRCWHEKCVHCAGCHKSFTDSCFSRSGKLYCKDCYKQIQFCCYRCSSVISGEEYVMRVGKDSYHVDCFSCDYCSKPLRRGDEFHSLHPDSMKRKICCKKCYDMDDVSNLKVTGSDSEESYPENDVFAPSIPPFMGSPHHGYSRQISDFYPGPPPAHMQGVRIACGKEAKSPSTSGILSTSDSKRTKRPRTILTTAQRRKFKASFEISQKPCRKVRETLANETGLTPRVVQVWFQNQRAKMKKIARRQSQGDSGNRRKRKKDVDSDSENEVPSSPGSYTSAPTPHQTQYFGEYQSPRSVQSTPTLDDNGQRVFSPNYHQQGFNHSDVSYDDYARLSHSMGESPYVPAPAQLPHSPTELEMHKMLHDRVNGPSSHEIISGVGDLAHHHEEMNGNHFNNDNIPDHYIPQHPHQEVIDISNDRSLGVPPTAGVANPIDSLMYMQSNFFST